MKCSLIERTYVGDAYCFSVTESEENFTISMCSHEEYFESESPNFFLVGIYKRDDGFTIEAIENMLDEPSFIFSATQAYIRSMREKEIITRESNQIKAEKITAEIQAIKEAIENSNSTCWTLEEACIYSCIGINRLRSESLKKGCPWVLWVGETKRLVKIDAFKEWLSKRTYIE